MQNVKIDKLPKLDFEDSVLKYATLANVQKKATQRLAKKNVETEEDAFDLLRGEDNESYFFEPKILQENIKHGVKCAKFEMLNGVKINEEVIESIQPKDGEETERMTLD